MIYNDFFQFLESKDRLIDRLDLTEDQKTKLKIFFKKYPGFESKIDWNRKDLTWEDFSELLANEGKSKSQAKKKGIEGLIEEKDYKIIESNDEYTIYYPMNHRASVTLASMKTAPFTEGKWCISMAKNSDYWDDYVEKFYDFFFVFYNPDVFKAKNDPAFIVHEFKFAIARQFSFNKAKDAPELYTIFDELDNESDIPYAHDEIMDIIAEVPHYLFETVITRVNTPEAEMTFSKDGKKLLQLIIKKEAEGKTIQLPDKVNEITDGALVLPEKPVIFTLVLPDDLKRIGCAALRGLSQEKLELPMHLSYMSINSRAIENSNIKVVECQDISDLNLMSGAFSLEVEPDESNGFMISRAKQIENSPGVTLIWPGTVGEFLVCLCSKTYLSAGQDMDYLGQKLNLRRFGVEKVITRDGTYTEFIGTAPFFEALTIEGYMIYNNEKWKAKFGEIYPDLFDLEKRTKLGEVY